MVGAPLLTPVADALPSDLRAANPTYCYNFINARLWYLTRLMINKKKTTNSKYHVFVTFQFVSYFHFTTQQFLVKAEKNFASGQGRRQKNYRGGEPTEKRPKNSTIKPRTWSKRWKMKQRNAAEFLGSIFYHANLFLML